MADLITCRYCGVVERGHNCPYRTKRVKKEKTKADYFRSSKVWTDKAIEIKERDKYLCQVCLTGEYHTINTLNYKNLEVHHIEPVNNNYNKRLDNDNLITLCKFHHRQAERNEIPVKFLKDILANKEN